MFVSGHNLIPLKKAAELFQVSENEIRYWIKKHKISYSIIDKKTYIDENDILGILENNYKVSRYCEYLNEEMRIRERELGNILFQISDVICLFRSIRNISPLLRAVINEMALLIPQEFPRTIFTETTRKMSPSEVAKKYGQPYDKVCRQYNATISFIGKKLGFIKEYRNITAELTWENRKLKILNKNQKDEIAYLCGLLEKANITFPEQWSSYVHEFPENIINMLYSQIRDVVKIDTRTYHCLHAKSIDTVEDLMRFVKNEGLTGLRKNKILGPTSFENFRTAVLESGILDEQENSYLFRYLS